MTDGKLECFGCGLRKRPKYFRILESGLKSLHCDWCEILLGLAPEVSEENLSKKKLRRKRRVERVTLHPSKKNPEKSTVQKPPYRLGTINGVTYQIIPDSNWVNGVWKFDGDKDTPHLPESVYRRLAPQ